MDSQKVNLRIPVTFQKLNEYNTDTTDERFMEVKIWLMHLGENYNGSYFSKEVVEKAIPTLANTPILGYIETDKDGEDDFSDHRYVLTKEDGKYKVKYIGQAYGVIPETNNAQFEKRVGKDGIEREYLTCTGIVWRKWDEPIDIFERDESKSQSMELSEVYDGEFKDDGLFHFIDFKFFGACALGDKVTPAMESATIEKNFSLDKFDEYIQLKMEEYKLIAMQKRVSTDSEPEINATKFSANEGGKKMSDMNDNKDFALSANQLTQELYTLLRELGGFEQDDWGWKSYNFYYVDHNDTHVFAQSKKDSNRLVGFEYSMSGDKPEINFDSKKTFKIEYVAVTDGQEVNFSLKTAELAEYEANVKAKEAEKEIESQFSKDKDEAVGQIQVEFTELQEKYSTLENEVNELREFKRSKQDEERKSAETEMFDRFSKLIDAEDEDFASLKEQSVNYEKLEDLEKELFALVGKKKANFSVAPKAKETPVKLPVETGDSQPVTSKYGELGVRYKS